MKLLAICIPNYNRINKLERLVRTVVEKISDKNLFDKVQLCISDDCSMENPDSLIEDIKILNPDVDIVYKRNTRNMGMDYNFLQSVMISDSKYCWIVGNDDLPTEDGIEICLDVLQKNVDIDILLSPFDIYDEEDNVRQTIYPLIQKQDILFDTSDKKQYECMLKSVAHSSGVFSFLSNVVFKREHWDKYAEKFTDKLDTIFIQMYMNIQTLEDGAKLLYIRDKIIRDYADDVTNNEIKRICGILFGLDGVVEYFFHGDIKLHLKRILVDAYISGKVWDLPEDNPYKKKLRKINSSKNYMYIKYFIEPEDRRRFFEHKTIFIYGAGNYGRLSYEELDRYGAKIIGIADSDISKIGEPFEQFQIVSVNEMVNVCKDREVYVIVANHFHLEDMVNTLLDRDIDKIAIVC